MVYYHYYVHYPVRNTFYWNVEMVQECLSYLVNIDRRIIKQSNYLDSNCCLRQYCGPSRPFAMSIIDNNQKEVIHLERPLRCSAWCCFCCLQTMEVQSPPGTVIGYVEQVYNNLPSLS